MANLRISLITVSTSINIVANFTAALDENIGVGNVSITSQTTGVADPDVLFVDVSGSTLNIQTQPLVPYAAYFITFQSTSEVSFKSLNGNLALPNDGVSNKQLIIAPPAPDNPVITYLTQFFQNNLYDTTQPSLVSSYIQGLSSVVSQCLFSIGQSANENYLSYQITDEQKIRGQGPFDRLNEESAYEVLRVGLTPTGGTATNLTQIPSFPNYPVSLAATSYTDTLTLGSQDLSGVFNLNDLTLNLTQQFVIILNSVVILYTSSASYTYDIQQYGYQIANSEYDPNYASTLISLATNQVVLNNQILNDPTFSLNNIASITVSYQYKDTGKIIDLTTLAIDTNIASTREATPPIENIFTLQHAPIVSAGDVISTSGGVRFIDPNALPGSNTPHPAFLYELPFRFDYLPSIPGQYSINYNTGVVYVFGADSTRTGTGAYPPLATYTYRYVFKENIDYVVQPDTFDLVALPNGSLIGSATNINYIYEEVLAQGIDYQADVHIEVLEEFINNNLVALNAIETQNYPITDVFRILNQTTGEVYSPIYWTDSQAYFTYNKAPNIQPEKTERASFQDITNEVLFVNASAVISGSINLIQFDLNNNNIIGSSQDCIGSSINTSVSFLEQTLFKQERYFDNYVSQTVNNARLQNLGDYQIDYVNGIVWLLASSTQGTYFGSISYKRGYIVSQFPNIITVNDIYYQLVVLGVKVKHFSYVSFTDNTILPSSFDNSNEEFLNDNVAYPYLLDSNQVGTIENASFTPGVSQPIKQVRGVFEYNDLANNIQPINFAPTATFDNTVITVAPLSISEYHTVQYNGTHYYVQLNTALYYQSPNITMNISVIRLSDSAQLWNSSGTVDLGANIELILPGIHSPAIGNQVIVVYSYTINNFARVVVDYDKGGYYIDYTYLYDTLIVSYEYGDNVLDFSQSNKLTAGQSYYVSYKVGALRDALLKNFGTLINIPILNDLDVSFARESYRDALMAAMQSFTAGPTIPSIYNIVNTIVHTPPTIIEAAYQNWTLGQSTLNPEPIQTTGNFDLVSAKYNNGVLINQPNQTITMPVSSNIRMENGSFECWVMPNWNGIDNQSDISITITEDGYTLPLQDIFIGQAGLHPSYSSGTTITLNTSSEDVFGIPNEHKNGVFIYYAPDVSEIFNRWYIDVIDGYSDGYGTKTYQLSITSPGKFYDVKSTVIPQPPTSSITSSNNKVVFNIAGTSDPMQGITFVADNRHYIFDFGENTKNRFSLFKDESGYMNFQIVDSWKNRYSVDADISSWQTGQMHFLAMSWSIGSKTGMDEMHLFIDGFEVPNIIKYGSKVVPYLHEKFRTVDPEEVAGAIAKNILSSVDLVTTFGSDLVSSSLDFDAYGIAAGGIIYIEENGFSTAGYTISVVDGQTLTLSTTMPHSITGGLFTINKTTFDVQTEIDLYANITVSVLHSVLAVADLQVISGSPNVYSPSTNFALLGIVPGNLIYINEPNFAITYTIIGVNTNTLTLTDPMPASHNLAPAHLYVNNPIEIPGVNALRPAYSLSRSAYPAFANQLTILNDAQDNDIVLINTLGLNNRLLTQNYYIWGSSSNIAMTKMPPPILLDQVQITHALLALTNIGPSNSTLSGGVFTSSSITTDQPSLSSSGRTLSVYISGDNINYTSPITVSINGTINSVLNQTETLTFTENTTQSTMNRFETVNHIVVVCKPNNVSQNCCVVSIQEAFPITVPENNSTIYPVIRYSYQMLVGNTLVGTDTDTVSDTNVFFSSNDVGNYLVITSPSEAAGQYQITAVSEDHTSITLSTVVPGVFTGGVYQVLNITDYSTGLQNGFFTFENDGYYGTPYQLVQGGYIFQYYTYLKLHIDPKEYTAYVGSDIDGNNQANAVIDDLQTLSIKLTDTRVGEMVAANQETITKDFNSLKALQPNSNTLMLASFDMLPFTNSANNYTIAATGFLQSGFSVNDSFDQSIVFTDTPLQLDNTGILNTPQQGTIEFWTSPLFDTANDPNYRFYFDATSVVSEQVVSINNATVVVSGRISNVLNVKLQVGGQTVDYYAGGSIGADMQTIHLRRPLPSQQTPVIVNYVPVGTNGNRLSIYKDPAGYINFGVQANNGSIVVQAPVFWTVGTWHRIMATFKFNYGIGTDEISLFVDGYERGNILFDGSLLFGQGQVFGSSYSGPNAINSSISFTDTINTLYVGSDYTMTQGAFALVDNFKISDVARPPLIVYGEAIDANYSTNTGICTPVVNDLYTTYLQNFDTIQQINTNTSALYDEDVGQYDFRVMIFDSYGIVEGSAKVKQVLETLIDTLKPANTTAVLDYVETPNVVALNGVA